jgi:predicted acetyltransferase
MGRRRRNPSDRRAGSSLPFAAMASLRLRPLRSDDEAAFLAAHAAMALEGFTFGLGYLPSMPWTDYLDALEHQRRGVELSDGLVPATLLVADVDDSIVGRASVRHVMNEHLARENGHIGYGVLAEHRRRGYATDILRQSLVVARSLGVDRVLITCDDGNVGSAAVIAACGGVFESVVYALDDGRPIRRYWID